MGMATFGFDSQVTAHECVELGFDWLENFSGLHGCVGLNEWFSRLRDMDLLGGHRAF